jgi:hypothetical protein
MKPSIGRIVHYYPTHGDSAAAKIGTPIAAVIVNVWSDECVNLRLITDGDDMPFITSVCLDEDHTEMSWDWPPRT